MLNEDDEIPENVMESAKIKADSMAQIMSYIGVDAVGVGEKDLALGIPYLKEIERKWDFPFVCANLLDANGAPVFRKYIIKEVAGKRIGVFGIISDTTDMVEKIEKATAGTVRIEDPLEAANSVMEELRGKTDYVVALAHEKTTYDYRLARRVDGIDLIVGGQDTMKTEKPKKAGSTLMVRSGEKGQYQGLIEIPADRTQDPVNTLIPYNDKIENDPLVKDMITAYNDKIVALYAGNTGSEEQASTTVALRASKCETCHSDAYAQWQTTDHAKAFSTLVGKKKQFDPSCLVCHTTRFEQPNGFTMKQQQPELKNVQCESCHGDATDHLAEMEPIPVPNPPVETCIKCHTADRCPDFEINYDEVWEKISH